MEKCKDNDPPDLREYQGRLILVSTCSVCGGIWFQCDATPYCSAKLPEVHNAPTATGEGSPDEPTRQATGMRFDLIPGDVLAQVARVLAEGAEKYGDTNWRKGRLVGDKDPINHALKHINFYNAGVPDDEDPDGVDMEIHLRNAIVNLMFELHYQLNQDKYGNRFE